MGLIEKFKGAKKTIALKKKATKEQWNKVKRGVSSYTDIKYKIKEEKKLWKRTHDKVHLDKYRRLKEILDHLKKMQIREAKNKGIEYDKLYPGDFDY